MKKIIDFFGWTSVAATVVVILCTFISTHRFMYFKIFNTYKVLQVCIVSTMGFWAVKLYGTDKGKRKWVYSIICLLFALATIYFMKSDVW